MRKLVLATRNEYKVKELKELLADIPFEIKTLADYPSVPLIEEDGSTYKANALKKAVLTANITGELALADDSGLEVKFLRGGPGIHSSRFASDDTSRIHKLLMAMKLVPPIERGAQFVCVVAIAEPHGQVWTVQGRCSGMITPIPLGTNGFGYDPIFLFPELKKTFAQLNSREKAHHGHRGKAIRSARLMLKRIETISASPIVSEPEELEIPRYASIDMGTNCLRLLIAEIDENGGFQPFLRRSEIVHLGHGIAEKKITPGGTLRVCQQLEKYWDILKKYPVLNIYAGATSAVRDAVNQEEFLKEIQDKFKLEVKVLKGEEEAELTFLGAISGISAEKLLVVDIGGGSTELIIGNGNKIDQVKSLNIGSVRYTEEYIFHDPVTQMELENVVKHIQIHLKTLEFPKMDSFITVGTGGTITTIAAMNRQLEKYDSTKIHGSAFSLSEVELLTEELAKRTITQRKELPGLDPKRADVILVGVLICREVMRFFGFKQMTVSERDLLDGLILSNIKSS